MAVMVATRLELQVTLVAVAVMAEPVVQPRLRAAVGATFSVRVPTTGRLVRAVLAAARPEGAREGVEDFMAAEGPVWLVEVVDPV